MKLTIKDVEHVAKLARLKFDGKEIEELTSQLDSIISYIEKMNELDTSQVEPTSHVIDMKNVFRPDEVGVSLPREDTLKNAPVQENGFFKVPKIIE
ncbi:MAG: Asp-tRNA(Asn)/Glu-tRNA(Gln) amidotransferase subunit GatC [Candidatus Schekmanbacteria bacterium]|nr:Asp-tRNA(Asn)/Glu-tRNA(Gln) amidotransferase subunit GatC [Candidatus Schekmanbacteria bacterium]